ncbi:MAG: hypothetical protein Q7U51_11090 [Methanoregula sp.]|nr:hypothetical protein [Methanoregula sp.]
MNENGVVVIFFVSLIFIIAVSGCITPPKEAPLNATTIKTKTTPDVPTPIDITVQTPVYVTIETPYVTPSPSSTFQYRTITPIPPVKEDYVVIYSIKNQPFTYNKSAVSFDLKNPPMLIDFSVSGTDKTRKIEGDSKVLTNEWTSMQVTYTDPNAYFEVIVREKTTGNIILRDGFGQSKQYGTEKSRHLKVYSAGNYLIEFAGNQVTANVNLSVKRQGNINQSIV